MAREAGFEPANVWVKTRCLKPLGDSPIYGKGGGNRTHRIRLQRPAQRPCHTPIVLLVTAPAIPDTWERKRLTIGRPHPVLGGDAEVRTPFIQPYEGCALPLVLHHHRSGTPNGTRTRILALRTQFPKPLEDGCIVLVPGASSLNNKSTNALRRAFRRGNHERITDRLRSGWRITCDLDDILVKGTRQADRV